MAQFTLQETQSWSVRFSLLLRIEDHTSQHSLSNLFIYIDPRIDFHITDPLIAFQVILRELKHAAKFSLPAYMLSLESIHNAAEPLAVRESLRPSKTSRNDSDEGMWPTTLCQFNLTLLSSGSQRV